MNAPKKPEPARQAGALVFGTTIATIAAALTPMLVYRLIGRGDVNRLLSVTFAYETIAVLLALGLPYAVLYQLSNREAAARAAIARQIAWTAAALGAGGATLVALFAGLVALLPAGATTPMLKSQLELLLILAPSLAADLPSRLLSNLLIAEGRARHSAVVQVLRTIALTLATLVPLALQASVATVIVVYAAVRWALSLVLFWELRSIYAGVPRAPSPLSARELFRFALPLGATDVLGQLNLQLDRWLVLLAVSGARFADYQAGAWQVPIVGTIAYSVGAAYMPELVRLFQAKQPYAALELWQRGIHKTALVVIPVTMALFVAADELVPLMFTKAYASGASVFRWYSVLTFLRVAAYGNVIVAAGRPGLVVRAAALGLTYNLAFGVPCVLTLGFIGPAVGAACAFVLHIATHVYMIGRAAEVPPQRVFPIKGYLRIFALASVGAVIAVGVKHFFHAAPWVLLLAELAIVLGVFALLGTLTKTIERSDWAYVREWLKLKH